MKDSKSFEQEVHRIYELLDGSGAEVIWNDHIPDPDNPSQQRQIDITVKRDGKLTHVECRKHKSPQDVQWIEELIGRSMSLAADSTIAVSSSGFTAGALLKAKRYGIITREFQQLTDIEIRSWARRVTLKLYFYQYSDLDVSIHFDRKSLSRVHPDVLKSELQSSGVLQSIFNAAARHLDAANLMANKQYGRLVAFRIRVDFPGFKLAGESVLEGEFSGKACLVEQEVQSTAVFKYREPGKDFAQRDAMVETFSLGETSIIHDGERASILLDVSRVQMPPFCQFRFFRVESEEDMDHEILELAGLEKLWVQGRIKVNICST
jgi:hypothetical protein